ncbi:MAG TPA: DUF559 domain-containing protein [Solirubrobacterales bacterium]|jgi:very-short-patch-repair endonuclease
MAAILACGAHPPRSGASASILDHWGAALSHLSAAALWGLLDTRDGPIDLSVRGNGGRAHRAGIRLHRRRSLKTVHVTAHRGIPVTTPAKTIADLASVLTERRLRQATREAEVLGLPTDTSAISDRTRSDLESLFLSFCRRHRLPRPEVNVRVGPHLVDFLWRNRRLVVETDGYRYHRGNVAFEEDRARDINLRSLGYDVIRVADRQLTEEPQQIADLLLWIFRQRP